MKVKTFDYAGPLYKTAKLTKSIMRFKTVIYCMLILLFLLFCWVVLSPSPIRGRSLDIRVIDVSSNNLKYPIFIVVSNVSKNAVTYDLGRTVDIAFLKDGVWETNSIGHFFIEEALLSPGQEDKFENFTEVPSGTAAIKIGISYISLLRRDKFAWKTPYNSVLSPVAAFLWKLDGSKRSKTEWSQVVVLNTSTNLQSEK